jgi:hypothetical protein
LEMIFRKDVLPCSAVWVFSSVLVFIFIINSGSDRSRFFFRPR